MSAQTPQQTTTRNGKTGQKGAPQQTQVHDYRGEGPRLERSAPDLHTISLYVANKPGVLARVAQVFARRGYNIESLVVSPALDGHYSRMTVTVKGAPENLDLIIRQMGKLVDVLHGIDHTDEDAAERELALVKVLSTPEERSPILQIVEHFKGKTVDLTQESLIIMVEGTTEKLDAFVRMIHNYRTVEVVRTGKVVMARGAEIT